MLNNNRIEELLAQIKDLEQKLHDMGLGWATARAQCAHLMVENVSLEEQVNRLGNRAHLAEGTLDMWANARAQLETAREATPSPSPKKCSQCGTASLPMGASVCMRCSLEVSDAKG